MRIISVIIIWVIIWMFWASLSTGGLYELKQLNPAYIQPDKNLEYLVSKINYSQANGYMDSYHVEVCSLYMPDWAKAKSCVAARILCEYQSPKKQGALGKKQIFFQKNINLAFKKNVRFLVSVNGCISLAPYGGFQYTRGYYG